MAGAQLTPGEKAASDGIEGKWPGCAARLHLKEQAGPMWTNSRSRESQNTELLPTVTGDRLFSVNRRIWTRETLKTPLGNGRFLG